MRKTFRIIAVGSVLGLIAWGVIAGQRYLAARRVGTAISTAIKSDWPAGQAPAAGTRERLMAAAERVAAGDFTESAADLTSNTAVSAQQRAAAGRFFAGHAELQQCFVAAAADAQTIEQDGDDVTSARTALARAVAAAARDDRSAVSLHVELAQNALKAIVSGEAGTAVGGSEAVAGLLQQMGPTFQLGRDLMTESHTTVEKLLRRARQHHRDKQDPQAANLIRLAAQLLSVDPSGTAAAGLPEWYLALESTATPDADDATASTAVQLCQSMADAEEPSAPVRTLIRNAQRELSAAHPAEAYWWAGAALNALGMTDEQITAAAGE